jgi:flagellar FliJ protein
VKKFTFRLDTLLKVRLMQEEEAQLKLTQATQLYLVEKEKEDSLILTKEKTVSEFCNKQHEVLTVETLKYYRYYIDKIREELFSQCQKTQKAAEDRLYCLKKLEEAMKNRELVEKLKEKQWQEYQEQALREEQFFLDELGVQAYSKDS